MSTFQLKSHFAPTGDQPKAIEELVRGLQEGTRDQILLGVTGSGKSLAGDEPLLVYRETDGGLLPECIRLDALCDPRLGPVAPGSQVAAVGGLWVPSLDPISGRVRLSAVSAVSRHAPESLFEVASACGRRALMTGDHNLYIRRGGALLLVETKDLQAGDELPLPAALPPVTRDLAEAEGPRGPVPLSAPMLRLLGGYLQAGGVQPQRPDTLLLSPRDDEFEDILSAALRSLALPVRRKRGAPLEVVSPLVAAAFADWCGASPKARRLPPFWAALSDTQLGLLLSGMLDRPGTVRLDGPSIDCLLLSPRLVEDSLFALLRLGIVAASRPTPEGGARLLIEGCDLRRFEEKVGFRAMRRRESLAVLSKQAPAAPPGDLRYTQVTHVRPAPLERAPLVYDLTVPGDETFLAGRGGFFVHNTFTVANTIQRIQRPALILAHNKTLAAQLYGEFKELFPDNAVHYFVSYYDYYQPEAYVPSSDTYIEKDAQINEEIDRMRHAATSALLSRPDVIIVASVSCIYGLGDPNTYASQRLFLEAGKPQDREAMLRRLVDMQYDRNDIDFARGAFRVRGDVVEVFPANEEDRALRIAFFGDEIESMSWVDPLRGRVLEKLTHATVPPNSHYVTEADSLKKTIRDIRDELRERLAHFRETGKLLEAQRLEERTMYDLEMLEQVGFCNGIENYSRLLTGRGPGEPPPTLLDYFPKDFVLFVDESHVSVPQLGAMYKGDRSRKETLVEYGFRLPSAMDNRPLKFDELLERYHQAIFVSATPGPWELERTQGVVVEQLIRPTGLIDPVLEVRPVKNQIDDLLEEIRKRVAVQERVLITTLTKRMAEDLTEYYVDVGVRVRYMHADVETLERTAILRALRKGEFDVLVGINLLREGLDLPEVSLVAILDADKEGFLRAERSLIQTFGRAARHINGKVIMYADVITPSMKKAMNETDRRRAIQEEYNKANNITPRTVVRSISELEPGDPDTDYGLVPEVPTATNSAEDIQANVKRLEKEMLEAAESLDFEKAAELRDKIRSLQAVALGMRPAAGAAAAVEDPGWVNPWAHARKKRQQQSQSGKERAADKRARRATREKR